MKSALYLGWFQLGLGDWMRLIPFGVAVGGFSYLSLQVVAPLIPSGSSTPFLPPTQGISTPLIPLT